MVRSPFIAARNSRHRIAALALYRALVRAASRVPVPQDGQPRAGKGPVEGPVVEVVRQRFAKNRPYTSFRLIYASMSAGYQFLNLLTKAQTPNSPEHTQILNHLQNRHQIAAASRAASRPRPKGPELPPEPLLFNIAKPGEPPKYTSRILPRPESSLTSRRKVPSLCATADGQPFVRIKKPQPRALSRMVGRKGKIWVKKVSRIVDIDEDIAPEATLEDEWDAMMDKLIQQESGSEKREWRDRNTFKMETFAWSVQLSRLWWEWKVEQTWEDWVARGEALHDLVEQERALAEQERNNQNAKPRKQMESLKKGATTPRQTGGPRPNVALFPGPSLPVLEAAKVGASMRSRAAPEDASDPFTSPAWAALVSAEQGRMLKWTGKQGGGSSPDEYAWKRPTK